MSMLGADDPGRLGVGAGGLWLDASSRLRVGDPAWKKCSIVVKLLERMELSLTFWRSGLEEVQHCRQVFGAIGALAYVLAIRGASNLASK